MNNKESLLKGMQKAKDLCYTKLLEKFEEWGNLLINDAVINGEYMHFTGNTVTSIAFGLYYGGMLDTITFVDGLKAPVRMKVKYNEPVELEFDYNGREGRAVVGEVNLVTEYGSELSVQTLQRIKPEGEVGIVVCTGTEYSVLLEDDKELNVLSETEQYANFWSHTWFANLINNHPNRPIEKL